MGNHLNLITGKKYRVVKPFVDYDGITHPAGEEWIFVKTNFVPYVDGLTLHVKESETSAEKVYRFEATKYGQGEIIGNFSAYVEEVNP